MIRFPNCKINLGLHVTARRDDGYHEIETVFYPVPVFDVLEILPAAGGAFSFNATGLEIPGTPDGNLCVKAFRLLDTACRIPPVSIHLHKMIPMGSGLGGGSSNGAFTLAMLSELFNLGLDKHALASHAGQLGSDCPFFILNEPCHATGRGEILTPVQVRLDGLFMVLVIPPVHVSTREAYGMVKPAVPACSLSELIREPVGNWRECLHNDFEAPVVTRFPVIGRIREELYNRGAIYASMSGSGSAVYGLFSEQPRELGFRDCFVAEVKL